MISMEIKINRTSLSVMILIFVIWEVINILYFGLLGLVGLITFSWIIYRANRYKILSKSDIIALLIMVGLTALAFYLNYVWLPKFVIANK